MNQKKYLIGLIALSLSFVGSCNFWRWYNEKELGKMAASQQPPSGMAGGAGGAGGQQAMMGQVAGVIERAKNSPNDFQAQLDAAKTFNQIGRKAETVEYLKKAYDANAVEFVRQSNTELEGVLPFLAIYFEDQRNYDESDKWIRRALDAAPNDSEIRVEFASMYLHREPPQADKALQELLAELKANPKDGHALGHLVEAYALKKDARGAEDTVKRLKETDPTNKRISVLETLVADLKAGKAVTIPKE